MDADSVTAFGYCAIVASILTHSTITLDLFFLLCLYFSVEVAAGTIRKIASDFLDVICSKIPARNGPGLDKPPTTSEHIAALWAMSLYMAVVGVRWAEAFMLGQHFCFFLVTFKKRTRDLPAFMGSHREWHDDPRALMAWR